MGMHFTTSFVALLAALTGFMKLLPNHAQIRVVASTGGIHLYGNDGGLQVRKHLVGDVVEQGEYTATLESMNAFAERVKGSYADTKISVKVIPDGLVLEANPITHLIPAYREFPMEHGPMVFSIKLRELQDTLKRVGYARPTTERVGLDGVIFDLKANGELVVGCTDGYRMAVENLIPSQLVMFGGKALRFNIDFHSLKNVDEFLADMVEGVGKLDREVDFHFTGTTVTLYVSGEDDDLSIVLKADAMPPQMETIIPVSFQYEVALDRAELRKFLSSTNSSQVVSLRFINEHDVELGLFDNADDMVYARRGAISYSLHSNNGGPVNFSICFNAEYLREAVFACRSTNILLGINTRLTPMVITPCLGTARVRHLVMPMNKEVPLPVKA